MVFSEQIKQAWRALCSGYEYAEFLPHTERCRIIVGETTPPHTPCYVVLRTNNQLPILVLNHAIETAVRLKADLVLLFHPNFIEKPRLETIRQWIKNSSVPCHEYPYHGKWQEGISRFLSENSNTFCLVLGTESTHEQPAALFADSAGEPHLENLLSVQPG
ncbi:MAG: hypothetical protein HQL49_12770 [Gammaproteobacteria bacterium]|nr:hypothetical protein [Gammaproteobacteria bacterium]